MVAMFTHTPGPQVGLYKAHSGNKWWSSEKLQPRIPPCVNVSFDFGVRVAVQNGDTGGCVEFFPLESLECLYKVNLRGAL